MKHLYIVLASFVLAVGVLAGCAPTGSSESNSSASASSGAASASSAASSAAPAVLPALSSDAASSDAASSDAASSDAASSDAASSDGASSNRSSEPVLSGPSGISEMNVTMNYMSDTELLAALGGSAKDMVVIDLRKPADAKAGHIEGAIFAPMNKAVDNNNYADAIANITGALYDATGNEVGEGKKLVLACYAGKKYAQAATDILNALGADMDNVYTLEGGMTAWDAAGHPTVAN